MIQYSVPLKITIDNPAYWMPRLRGA